MQGLVHFDFCSHMLDEQRARLIGLCKFRSAQVIVREPVEEEKLLVVGMADSVESVWNNGVIRDAALLPLVRRATRG